MDGKLLLDCFIMELLEVGQWNILTTDVEWQNIDNKVDEKMT